jgi:hypothetical protein
MNNLKDLLSKLISENESFFWAECDEREKKVHLGIYNEVQLYFNYDEIKDLSYIQKVTFNKGEFKSHMYIPFRPTTKEYSLIKNLISLIQEKFRDEEFRSNLSTHHQLLIYKTTNFIFDNFPE